MSEALQIRPGPLYQGAKPIRDSEYHRFILKCSTTSTKRN
jgi:hypothetical protein